MPKWLNRFLYTITNWKYQNRLRGGVSPANGFDCSGLVQYVYRQAGISMPHTDDLQFLVGRTVAPSALQTGDLVYFKTHEPGASHVGIYIGGLTPSVFMQKTHNPVCGSLRF
ncbi:MAG: hypothetical protein H6Q65_740 [Firmicutes bacterium]|nr:hypothetical protein [Bacillota bacterium]